jgi:hypothetical protein
MWQEQIIVERKDKAVLREDAVLVVIDLEYKEK